MSIEKYVINKQKQNSVFDLRLFGKYPVHIINRFNKTINLKNVVRDVEKAFPFGKKLSKILDVVYVGDFEFLRERSLNALYEDGAIYISNEQDNELDIVEDVIHELGHVVEQLFNAHVYGDGELEIEFLQARQNLKIEIGVWAREHKRADVLEEMGKINFLDIEYDPNFDALLYRSVGYDVLAFLCMDFFISPYGATSISEYFANGFEYLYTKKVFPEEAKSISPKLYKKISELDKRHRDE